MIDQNDEEKLAKTHCSICTAPTAYRHYGVLCCDPCKSFVRRTFRNSKDLVWVQKRRITESLQMQKWPEVPRAVQYRPHLRLLSVAEML